MKRTKTHDRKCFDLAEHFMFDEPEMNCDEACDELAGVIQEAVEDWIIARRSEHGLPVLAVTPPAPPSARGRPE